MATTRSALVARCRVLLQDVDIRGYVWPTAVLELFCDLGLRRLAPYVCRRVGATVTADSVTTTFSLATLTAGAFGVERVVSDEALEWDVYAGDLIFDAAPTEDCVARLLVAYSDVNELADSVADTVGFFVCGEALGWLVNRGGEALERYLSGQGQMSSEEVLSAARHYQEQFMAGRDEFTVSTTVRF